MAVTIPQAEITDLPFWPSVDELLAKIHVLDGVVGAQVRVDGPASPIMSADDAKNADEEEKEEDCTGEEEASNDGFRGDEVEEEEIEAGEEGEDVEEEEDVKVMVGGIEISREEEEVGGGLAEDGEEGGGRSENRKIMAKA